MERVRWVGVSAKNSGGVGVKFLLDSVILIDHFNNITAATKYLLESQEESAIYVITRAEVLVGFEPPDAESDGGSISPE